MAHLLLGKEETLCVIIDTNDLLLARLCDSMHESTEQEIKAETTSYGRNRRLLEWLKRSPPDAFSAFIWALRINGQAHVANFIMGTPGDLPLRDDIRKRLRRIRGTLINILYTNDELLDYLLGERVISEFDYQTIGAELTLNQKNSKLVEIVMRGSERNFQCFKDVLLYVNQGHVVKYIEKGEVLPIHVEFTELKHAPEKEESLLTMLKKLATVVPENWLGDALPIDLSDDQRRKLVDCMRSLKAVILGGELTQSILMYAYVESVGILEMVWKMLQTGQLCKVIEDLCWCLAGEETGAAAISIKREDYDMCRDELSLSNNEEKAIVNCLPLKPRPSRMKATTTSEPVSCQGILTMQEEICQLRTQVDELIRRRQHTEMALNAAKHCLQTACAATDEQLSTTVVESIQEAIYRIEQCFEGVPSGCDIESTINWVLQQDYQTANTEDEAVSEGISASCDDDLLSVDTGYKSYKTQSVLTSSLQSQLPYYSMNGPQRGKFIVISNMTFSATSSLPTRQGAGRDAEMLCAIFRQLDFDVSIYIDQTVEQMCFIMAAAAQGDHNDSDCFAAAILSHGDGDNQVYGVDGSCIPISRLTDPIKDCVALAGKPKIFFFEASRGKFDTEEEMDTSVNSRIPLEADILYAFSTAEGYFSFRNPLRGSWFTQTLCDELKDMVSSGSVDLERVLTKVRYRIAYTQMSNSAGMRGRKQVPAVYSTLTKRLSIHVRE